MKSRFLVSTLSLILGLAGGYAATVKAPAPKHDPQTKRRSPKIEAPKVEDLSGLAAENAALEERLKRCETRLAALRAEGEEAPPKAASQLEAPWGSLLERFEAFGLPVEKAVNQPSGLRVFLAFLPRLKKSSEAFGFLLGRLRDAEAPPSEVMLALLFSRLLELNPEERAEIARAVIRRLRGPGDGAFLSRLGLQLTIDEAPPPDVIDKLFDAALRGETAEGRSRAATQIGNIKRALIQKRALAAVLDPGASEESRLFLFGNIDWSAVDDAEDHLLKLSRLPRLAFFALDRLRDLPPSAVVRSHLEDVLLSETASRGYSAAGALAVHGDRDSLGLLRRLAAEPEINPNLRRRFKESADELEKRLAEGR